MLFNLFKPNIQKLKDAKDYQGLIKALENKDENFRYDAIDALGELKSQDALEPLIKIMNELDVTAVIKAVIALEKFTTVLFYHIKFYQSPNNRDLEAA